MYDDDDDEQECVWAAGVLAGDGSRKKEDASTFLPSVSLSQTFPWRRDAKPVAGRVGVGGGGGRGWLQIFPR